MGYWDLNMRNCGKEKAACVLQTLIYIGGRIEESSFSGPGDAKAFWAQPQYFRVKLRIWLPDNKAQEFEALTTMCLDRVPIVWAPPKEITNV